jgi:glutaredoxin 3
MTTEIKVYNRPSCSWGEKLITWLKKNNHPFQELDTTEEKVYRDEVLNKSGQMALPVIDIAGKIIVGFQEDLIKKALVN